MLFKLTKDTGPVRVTKRARNQLTSHLVRSSTFVAFTRRVQWGISAASSTIWTLGLLLPKAQILNCQNGSVLPSSWFANIWENLMTIIFYKRLFLNVLEYLVWYSDGCPCHAPGSAGPGPYLYVGPVNRSFIRMVSREKSILYKNIYNWRNCFYIVFCDYCISWYSMFCESAVFNVEQEVGPE